MKTLKFKDIVGFDGKPQKDAIPMKDQLANILGGHKAKDGKDSVVAMTAAQKIYQANGQADLENAEFDMMVVALEAVQMPSIVRAPIQQAIDEAEKKEEKKKE